MEIIEITNPTEQNLAVNYGERQIVLELRWNDLLNYWFLNVKENIKGEWVYLGLGMTMSLNSNLFFDKWNLGKLYLIDVEQGQTTEPIKKEDLGTRLALARVWGE